MERYNVQARARADDDYVCIVRDVPKQVALQHVMKRYRKKCDYQLVKTPDVCTCHSCLFMAEGTPI